MPGCGSQFIRPLFSLICRRLLIILIFFSSKFGDIHLKVGSFSKFYKSVALKFLFSFGTGQSLLS